MKNTPLNEDLAMLGLPGLEEAKAAVQPEIYEVARELVDREYEQFSGDPEDYIRSMSWVKEEWPRIKELSGKLAFTKEDVDELARMLQKKKISTLEAAIEDDNAADYVVNLVARDIKKLYPKTKTPKNEAVSDRRTHSILYDLSRGRLRSPYELQPDDVGKELSGDFGPVGKQDVGKQVVLRDGILQMENPEQMKKRKGIKEDQLAGWKAGQEKLTEAKAEPLPGVSNVQGHLELNTAGNSFDANEIYDYDQAVDKDGYFGITRLNADKVIKFFEGKKIDVREFEKNVLGGEFDSETFTKYRGTGDKHFIYNPDVDSESLMLIEKDEKYYLAIWADTVGFVPNAVCELPDEIDLQDYYGIFGLSAIITFDYKGENYWISSDGTGGYGSLETSDELPADFPGIDDLPKLWNALAAMQDNKPVQEAGEDELEAKQREWMLKEKKGEQKKPDWKSGDQVFFDRQGLLRAGVVRFVGVLDGLARVAMSGAPARPDTAIAGLPVSRITQIVVVPADQLYATADEAKAGRQKRQDAARGLKTEVAAKSTVRYSRREWDGPICALLDSEGKEVDRIDGAELLAAYCEEQGIEYDEEDWNDGSATVSLEGKEIDTIDGDILVDDYMDDQGSYIMEGRLQKKRQVSLGEDGRMLGIFTPQMIGSEKDNSKVVVYDNGGKTVDRYTVVVGNSVYTMCEKALSPQGVNQYAGSTSEIKPGPHLGKKVKIADLPTDVQAAIRQRANLASVKLEDGGRERCPSCGLPGPAMPEDATWDEKLCNSCHEKWEKGEFEKPGAKTEADESWWDKVKDKPETAELFKQAEKLAKTIDREKYHNNKWVTEVGDLYVTTWWDFRSKNWITFAITKEDGYQEGDSQYTGRQEDAKAAHYGMIKELERIKKEFK